MSNIEKLIENLSDIGQEKGRNYMSNIEKVIENLSDTDKEKGFFSKKTLNVNY